MERILSWWASVPRKDPTLQLQLKSCRVGELTNQNHVNWLTADQPKLWLMALQRRICEGQLPRGGSGATHLFRCLAPHHVRQSGRPTPLQGSSGPHRKGRRRVRIRCSAVSPKSGVPL